MAYNPYTAVNAIFNLKGEWDSANSAGDDTKKNEAAKKAQSFYNQLRKNGYSDVADELTAANYTQAKAINDKWAKKGKTSTRDYLYSLGKGYGMSTTDVDNLIGYDNQTGEVSFGGKKIGTPDSVVDGTSYWNDTSVLDNAFNDYVSRSGTTRSNTQAINQENESLFKKYNQEYEDLKNTNPFTTPEAKSILAKYDLAGLQGRDNEVASGAGSNGGNIDSFAAANALRQQTAMVTQGQQVVLDAYQQKLDHAKSLLSDMGVNIDRVFNQDETAKNNQVSRDVATSEVTGVVPESMSYANNPFFNSDGTLKNEETDYQAIINNATEKLKTTTNSAEKANLEATIKYAKQARIYKVQNNPAYVRWADTLELWSPDETADYKVQNKQIDSAERIATGETAASLEASKAQNASNENIANINAQSAVDQIKAGTDAQKDIAKYYAENGLTFDADGNVVSASSGTLEERKTATDQTISQWLYSPYADLSMDTMWKDELEGKSVQRIAAEKMCDQSIVNDIKSALKESGYTDKEVEDKIKEYRRNISIQIYQIENDGASPTEADIEYIMSEYAWAN